MRLLPLSALFLLGNGVWASDHEQHQQALLSSSSSSSSSSTSSLLSLHRALMEIESITRNEHDVTQWLSSYLQSHNFTVETQLVTPATAFHKARHNILAYLGNSRHSRTLITSHVDTVPPFWPYERRGDEIWGRGSADAKGSVAAQVTAVQTLRAQGALNDGDIALLFVVGEEASADGMLRANDLGLAWETVIFGEPTEGKLATGHKGIMGLQIRAKGKAGHSGYPELGRNANSMLIPALYALQKLELPSSEKYGNTTLNIGKVEGGVAANVIAEDAVADISIRIAGGTPAELEKVLLEAIQKTGEELDVKVRIGYGPVHIDSDVEGFDKIVVNYGTDIPNLKGDHKRYLYGPGSILVAHSDHEHVTVSELEAAVQGYIKLIEHSLR